MIDNVQLQRLERESERFTNEIRLKEAENIRLREEVDNLKSQISVTQGTYDELSQVSVGYRLLPTHDIDNK